MHAKLAAIAVGIFIDSNDDCDYQYEHLPTHFAPARYKGIAIKTAKKVPTSFWFWNKTFHLVVEIKKIAETVSVYVENIKRR